MKEKQADAKKDFDHSVKNSFAQRKRMMRVLPNGREDDTVKGKTEEFYIRTCGTGGGT